MFRILVSLYVYFIFVYWSVWVAEVAKIKKNNISCKKKDI